MRVRYGVQWLCLVALSAVWPAAAQIPVGDPFVVNTTTPGVQKDPDVAIGPDGRFAVVWKAENQDGSGSGIFARWFSSTGTALTGEVQVNTYTAGNQYGPRVDSDGQGRFVIVWVDAARGIIGRRFDAFGGALGDELIVAASGDAYAGAVSANDGGSFVVSWMRTTASDSFVESRRYNTNGLPIADAFTVSTFVGLTVWGDTAVELRDDRSFLVVWGDGEEVYVRCYDTAGDPAGAEVQISQLGPSSFRAFKLNVGSEEPDLYRVFWTMDINLEEVTPLTRMINTSGWLGPLVDLDRPTYWLPAYSTTDDGSFVVAHSMSLGYGAERYASDYSVLSEFVLTEQPEPSLCCAGLAHHRSDSRELVAVWSEPPPGGYPDFDIKARLFSGRIFSDGFESGDTSAWDLTVP